MKLWLSSSLVTNLGAGRAELLKNKAIFSNFILPSADALFQKLKSCSAFTLDELQASVSPAGRLFYTWLYPSEVISLGWHEETPKPVDSYAFQELQRSEIKKNKKKKTQKIDVGSAGDDRWPRWAFKLSAVQYVHLEMYQMITTSLLPRTYSEKAIFNRLVYTVSQNCIKRQSIWAISRKKKKRKSNVLPQEYSM